ncbi:MAG: DUF1987 domain-containing protein [Bacteroidales bacterium]|nr:DUF1987 domain-containing protein [Bacteroidales bacterium]
MENLFIEQTSYTPQVYFDEEGNKLCLTGRSFPEDATSFYTPVLAWFETNKNNLQANFSVEVLLDYYNTASSKYLVKLFRMTEELHEKKGLTVSIVWKYATNDEDMKEAGSEYKQFIDIPFEMVEVEKKVL